MSRLGYDRFGAQGGDWGSAVTTAVGELHRERVVGIHVNMPTVPLGPLTDDATPTRARELRRLRMAHALGHGLPAPAVHPPPDPRLRTGRLARRAARVDRREVLGVDRLRRRPAEHLHPRPAARQRDDRTGSPAPARRRPASTGRARARRRPTDPAADGGADRPGHRADRLLGVPAGDPPTVTPVGRAAVHRTSTTGTSPRRAATSPRSSNRRCSSTRCEPRSVRCADRRRVQANSRGRRSSHGFASSSWRATCSRSASSSRRPARCTPIGRPSADHAKRNAHRGLPREVERLREVGETHERLHVRLGILVPRRPIDRGCHDAGGRADEHVVGVPEFEERQRGGAHRLHLFA